jgi:hypothetical protein
VAAIGINFQIASGAIPPGALYYQINCGPPIPVGQPICLNGPGPHILTFCKPGNNTNSFAIISLPMPAISASVNDIATSRCSAILAAQTAGIDEQNISWTSIPFNAIYNSYLSCTTGCDTVSVTPTGNFPPFVDYVVSGFAMGGCDSGAVSDTVRVYFLNDVQVSVSPSNVTLCNGTSTTTVTATASGGSGSYQYLWSNGQTSSSIQASAGTYNVTVTDTGVCSTASAAATINVMPTIIANS